jgi:hypothetical protein
MVPVLVATDDARAHQGYCCGGLTVIVALWAATLAAIGFPPF